MAGTIDIVMTISAFSLILTFSRWEKEQPLDHFLKPAAAQAVFNRGFAWVLGAYLPAGEGRGEGERA